VSTFTLEELDAALSKVTAETPVDDVALLWMCRAELVGVPFVPEHLTFVMGLSPDEALDVCARLSEKGMIDLD
jgi:hypothetical protein